MINFQVKKDGFTQFNLDWWKPTQKEWAPVLLKDQAVPWRQESDPTTGRPWVSLTPKYALAKLRKFPGQPILRATGKMQDEAKILPKGEGFEVKASPYGAYHQFGTSRMAARPWVGIPDNSLKQLSPIAWKHILSRKS
jgi:phage gpG-like protein